MRGEEGKAGQGENEEKERGCRDTQPHLQLLAWLSVRPIQLVLHTRGKLVCLPCRSHDNILYSSSALHKEPVLLR